jgi:tRNA A-37 threonylcarbamoyl transferase component Bud32
VSGRAADTQRLVKAEPRTLVWGEALADGKRGCFKMYRRRGILDPVRHLFVPYRVEREFRLLARLHAAGVPCPQPLRWWQDHDPHHGWHEVLLTREIPAAMPLRDLLRDRRRAPPDLAPLFAIARRMHECGIAHGAFYAANVLVTRRAGSPPEFHVLDLAHGAGFRASVVGRPPAQYDLLDFLRSLERVGAPTTRARDWLGPGGYGLDDAAAARILQKLPGHRLKRPWRHLRRAETDTREFLDRLVSSRRA